ncbi:MAG: CvpA family protein [Chitinophagaceae bacterium]|nr:CvpA family protein [Chitinophagaceae bacterium]
MILDAIVILLGVLAFIRGWKKGLLWAVCSLIAVIAGVFLSLKLSHTLAAYLFENNILTNSYTLLICFILIFLITIVVFRLGIRLIEGILDKIFLGWVNKIAGGAIYTLFVLFVVSTFLWLMNKAGVLNTEVKAGSKSYTYVEPVAPKLIEWTTRFWPTMKEMYGDIEGRLGHDDPQGGKSEPGE